MECKDVAVIVRNTFIELKKAHISAQRRSSSEPPGFGPNAVAALSAQRRSSFGSQGDDGTTPVETQRQQQPRREERADADPPVLSARSNSNECKQRTSTSVISPRSDESTTASYQQESGPDSDVPDLRDFVICVNKIENTTLGIDVKRKGGTTLLVKSVSSDGLVDRWNQDNPPHLRVDAGSHIVTVNGVSGDASDMLKECQRAQVLHMRLISDADVETLNLLVSALPGSRKRRKDNRPKLFSPSEPARSAASASDAASQNSEVETTAPVSNEARSDYDSEPWSTSAVQAPQLSLVSLLPMADSRCQNDSTSLASCTRSQRTRLKSSSPLFAPSSCEQTGELRVSRHGACGEMSDVLKNTARALTFNPDVHGIQVVESDLGFSASIHIELPPFNPRQKVPAHMPSASQVVSRHAKSALLDVAAKSQNTYVVGYLDQPFTDVGVSSFKATLAVMRQVETACTDFYEKGRCDNRNRCCWCHPATEDVMVVWVNIQHSVEQS